jgi:tetratricopeptide (TPR) repeat protein
LGESWSLINLGEVCLRTGDYAGARGYLEQALALCREIGSRWLESYILAYLGLLFHRLGDDEAARKHSQQALGIAQDMGAQRQAVVALTVLGHALVELGCLEEAAAAYRDAQHLWRELGHLSPAMDSLAGLARVSLAQGDPSQAQAQVGGILSYLETNSLEGTDEPFRVYLTCYRVLKANQDPRAQEILTTAYNLLQEHAGNTADEEMRRSFLENVSTHRELVREWARGA